MKNKYFLAAMYLRLSRNDGGIGGEKTESNSIKSQRELIRDYIHGQQDMELYDSYVDDGYSGSNFDRPEFKRMMADINEGKVNCIIVKDLSRFGRDYIESGRYIQKIFPALGVRFLALTDHYDSFHADIGESSIVLPVKNFINDSYCRDISTKVRSQLAVKRKNGECIAAFAIYGYQKSETDKNQLVIDAYAADIVRRIFEWKINGMANSAIAKKLNDMGVLSPREYKKSTGSNYKGGFSGAAKSMWSSSTVKRMLINETYLGHLIQGKTEKINYKLKKSIQKPKETWIKVEHTHEPIISEANFAIVQNLLRSDSREGPVTKKSSPFAGILFCGDCGEQMIRRVNRYKNVRKVYDICSTKNRGQGCTRHGIAEEQLKELVEMCIRKYVSCFLEEQKLSQKVWELEVNYEVVTRCDMEIARLRQKKEQYEALLPGLYADLKKEILTKEEYERLYRKFKQKIAEVEEVRKKQEAMKQELLKNGVIAAKHLKEAQDCVSLQEVDRYTLCSMVKEIIVYEDQRIELVFYYKDHYRQ